MRPLATIIEPQGSAGATFIEFFAVSIGFFIICILFRSIRAIQNSRISNTNCSISESYIDSYEFHHSIINSFALKHPKLSKTKVDRVFDGLKEYFSASYRAGGSELAMPSLIVGEAWHDFILHTKLYEDFCSNAFGKYLHHTPSTALTVSSMDIDRQALMNTWSYLNSGSYTSRKDGDGLYIPLIFLIDVELAIAGGVEYSFDKNDPNSPCFSS